MNRTFVTELNCRLPEAQLTQFGALLTYTVRKAPFVG
jgi:hypothetical protein